MENKKALIIGAGIAGLCMGIYLRKKGYETTILEMHTISGGLATAWKKKGYTFENCIHWLVGSKVGEQMNLMWKEVFDINQLKFYEDEIFQVIEKNDERLIIYRNADKLEAELLAKAPEDATAIKEFTGLVRLFSTFKFPDSDAFFSRMLYYVKIVKYLPAMNKYSKLTMADYAQRFKNPLLKHFFDSGIGELSLLAIVFSLAWMHNCDAGYPIGGSLKMIGLIEETYKKLGGEIKFRAKVKQIQVENNRAVGVVLENGEQIKADVVISAADGYATIYKMLEGKFVDNKINKIYETYKPFPSYVQVSFGVNDSFKDEPGFINILLDHEIEIDPETRMNNLSFRIFNYDPTFAPPGKTAIVCFIPTYNYEYWITLRENDNSLYADQKNKIAQEVIAIFEKRFPFAHDKIEVLDVATPATVFRYTGNWKASMEGWLLTPATGFGQLPATLPNLKNFYMVGQWISPGGGLPSGLLTARNVSKII
ncbi:MAG: hypothetical protein A2Y62_14845 [Candidatus Fischerbacteria bacterium RBG_13_37_8]|uniref:Amine oxidase domain-containing protein n=1 Tax=Candidatus Fischerbacteria bacterium RBG_13_37_8 TaxID=1817863 RepID=A0A1F5VMS8_9BACT|nr:MAG: hypothetical protein A2Y62_14845 [Candidatus Fischerbacteria bacterium RBG_13_37_8]